MKITHETYAIRNEITKRNLHELKGLNPEQVQTIVDLLKEIQGNRGRLASKWSKGIDYGTGALREQGDSIENGRCSHDYRALANSIDIVECRADGHCLGDRVEGMALFYCTKCLDIQRKVIT